MQEIKRVAQEENVEWQFAMAVAQMESGKDLKCGQLNKKKEWSETLHGPFGVRGCFLDTGQAMEVIKVGVRSLKGTKTHDSKIRRLKKYNPEWRKGNYLRDVMATYRKFQKEK